MKPILLTSCIEALENRVAPAGVVTVFTTTSGELTITGDNLDNQFSIFETAPNVFRIEGLSGTTLNVNGTPGLLSFDFDKLTKLAVSGNDGNDIFKFTNLSTLTSLAVDGNAGADAFTGVNIGVKGDVDFSGDAGDDFFGMEGLTTSVTGNVRLTDSTGGATLNFGAEKTAIGGSVIVEGGTGNESLDSSGPGTLSIAKGVDFNTGPSGGGDISFTTSGIINIGKLSTGESVLVSGTDSGSLSLGLGDITLASGIRLNGGPTAELLQIVSPEHKVKIGKLSTGQSILFNAGEGFSSLFLHAMNFNFAGGIEMSTTGGGGNIDLSSPNGKIKVGKLPTGQSVKYTGGPDTDLIAINAANLKFTGGIEFLGGDGQNSLSFSSANGIASFGKLPTGASIKHSGTSGPDTVNLSVALLKLSGGIDFAGSDGANSLTINAPNGTAKIGKLTSGGASIKYLGGSGTDTITTTSMSLNLAGGIDYAGGASNSILNFNGPNGKMSVGKLSTGQSLNYLGGAGTDNLTTNLARVVFAGGIEISADDGSNAFTFLGNTGLFTAGRLPSGQTVLYTGGGGTDTFSSGQAIVTLAGGVEFSPGNGNNSITLGTAGRITIGKLAAGQSVKYTGGNDADGTLIGGNVVLKGSIELLGNTGGNSVAFEGTSVVIGKGITGESIKLTGSTGPDRIDFGENVKVSGSIFLDGGADNDVLNLTGMDRLKVDGGITFNGGTGDDVFSGNLSNLKVSGGITFDGGDGRDSFNLITDGAIGGDVLIELGNSIAVGQSVTIDSRTGLVPGVFVKGRLTVNTAGTAASPDFISISNLSVLKDFSSTLGDGDSTVTIDNLLVRGEFTLATGDGADIVLIERNNLFGNSVFAKIANILTGAGTDSISIGDSIPIPTTGFPDSTRVRFLVGLKLDGGADVDVTNDIAADNDFPAGMGTFVPTNIP